MTQTQPESELKRIIDTTIQRLVDALHAFDGIYTIGSCGGHREPLQGG